MNVLNFNPCLTQYDQTVIYKKDQNPDQRLPQHERAFHRGLTVAIRYEEALWPKNWR